MKLKCLILFYFTLNACKPYQLDIAVDEYIKIVLAYFRVRNVWILTHFTCFPPSDNVHISLALSSASIQSRFIGGLTEIFQYTDTPLQTIQGFVVDKICEQNWTVFFHKNHDIIFKNSHLWLFIDNDTTMGSNETIVQYESEFNGFDAMPASDLFIAKRIENEKLYWQLYDAYKLNYDYDIEVSKNGMITEVDDDLSIVGANFSTARRQNLKGAVVTCGLMLSAPNQFTYVDDPSNSHVDVFTKASINLGQNVLDNLNISCDMRQTESSDWPENSTFDGVVGLFQNKAIQMTSHGVNMRVERLKYASFAGDIFTPRTPLIFRQPTLSSVANIFVLPFQLDIWICTCILLLVIFIIMIVQLTHPILKPMSITTFDIATFIWGAVCQQGTHLHIPTTSGRIVVLTAFFATLALFTSYSASIVALLQSPSNFIKNLDDLIASPLKVGMHEAGYARYNVRENYSGASEVYAKKVRPHGETGWIYDPYVGIERVRTELFAFQVDSPSAYKAISKTFTESEKCSLSELQMIILPKTTILVERNSGFKELITQRIKWQTETGLMKRDELRWIPKKPNCEGGSRNFMTVGLTEMKPAAFLLLFGYGLSVLIFVSEILFRKCYNPCRGQKTIQGKSRNINQYRGRNKVRLKIHPKFNV